MAGGRPVRILPIALAILLASLQGCNGFTPRAPFGRAASSSLSVASGIQQDLTFTPPDTSEILEEACIETASRMKRIPVPVSKDVSDSGSVGISYVHWEAKGSKRAGLPLILLHGFDSSCLEYRRLGARLAERGIDTFAVDILGWGFTQLDDVASFSASAKIEALNSFVSTMFGANAQFFVAGASLGGAAAIELASSNPESCQGLILIDAQGFVDGIGPMASLPTPLARAGVGVLKSTPLRSSANQMSYFDKETFATTDALNIGRIHCMREGWSDAMVSFMQSGGFSPSSKVPGIEAPSLILWGRQDGILDGEEFANKFVETLPDARLRWIEECGHVPHLEKPDETADAILQFLTSDEFLPSVPEGKSGMNKWAVGAVTGASAIAAAIGAFGMS